MRELTAGFFALLLLAFPLGAQVERGGTLPGPLPLFPPDNWWNTDISSAPVDPASTAFINFIGPTRGLHPDLGGDVAPPAPDIYGIPYIVVPGSQPLEQVVFEYDDESDSGAPGRPPGYPIPVEARTEPKWIEGGQPGGGTSGDRHMLIVDRDNRILFELFAAHWNGTLKRWEAGSGAIFPLDSNLRRPDGWTSADAAGLAILPGLIRHDEVYGTGSINHAFRVTVRATNGYVYPASHRAGSTQGALPMGARLRLKPSKDISGYPEPLRKIFQAMKTYGLIVADNGSDMYITGTYDTRWDNDLLNPAFREIKAGDFEVVQLGWTPSTPPICEGVVITSHPTSRTINAGQSTTLSVSTTGTAPISYQWFIGSSGVLSNPIGGATQSSLTVSPSSTTNYWVRASNDCDSKNSTTATVTVVTPCTRPTITSEPASQQIRSGSQATLRVEASGTGPLTYQWYAGNASDLSNPIVNATSPQYITPVLTEPASYWVRVTNGCGNDDSTTATITIKGRKRGVRR